MQRVGRCFYVSLCSALELVDKYQTFDPEEICDNMGIHIVKHDLPINIEGFFQNIYDEFLIFINTNVCEEKVSSIIAHELAHIILHSELNTLFLQENTYLNVDRYEREADLFATTLLIDRYMDEESIETISKMIFMPIETVETVLKFAMKNPK